MNTRSMVRRNASGREDVYKRQLQYAVKFNVEFYSTRGREIGNLSPLAWLRLPALRLETVPIRRLHRRHFFKPHMWFTIYLFYTLERRDELI